MTTLPPLPVELLPEVDLRQMLVLTDDTGIAQHAMYGTPDFHHGYCTDDNARALIAAIVAMRLEAHSPETLIVPEGVEPHDLLVLAQRYLGFLHYAFNAERKRFKNFMSFDRRWLEDVGSQDSHARSLWALGLAVTVGHVDAVTELAGKLFRSSLPGVEDFRHVRPWAYALLGISEYLWACPDDDEVAEHGQRLSTRLFEVWKSNSAREWPWWEDELTWGNAKLPHALLLMGEFHKNQEMIGAASRSLQWLSEVQTNEKGQFSIIGNQGWYVRGRKRARFDQQPIEAQSHVQACLAAARITRDAYWTREALRAFRWFQGENDSGIPLYNEETGGGHDGLQENGVNENQGAESTLAYVLSVLELHRYRYLQHHDGQLPRGSGPASH